MKVKASVLITVLVLGISSLAVMAGSSSSYFGSRYAAYAELTAISSAATATTTPEGNGTPSVNVKLCAGSVEGPWASGGTWACATAAFSQLGAAATHGRSYHTCGTDTVSLTAYI